MLVGFRQSRGKLWPVILSDRDIRSAIDSGHLGISPFDPTMVQPSRIDVRLDRYFRVFNNARYTHIDPKQEQEDLTSLVEVKEGDAFILHPGEFVLMSSPAETPYGSGSLGSKYQGQRGPTASKAYMNFR